MNDLSKFITAHEKYFEQALYEISNGRKETHWMWYIFPQLKGLGESSMSEHYGISDKQEAEMYLANDYLRNHMIIICTELLKLDTNNADSVFGYPDNLKLRSSMTLFCELSSNSVFTRVLDKFYNGEKDELTLNLLSKDD